MDVKLTIYDSERQYFSKKIKTPCLIGRGKQSNIAIVHPLISRQHCEIVEKNGAIWVRDLASLNGTFYRGARIQRAGVAIPFGEAFSIGSLFFLLEPVDSTTTKYYVVPEQTESTTAANPAGFAPPPVSPPPVPTPPPPPQRADLTPPPVAFDIPNGEDDEIVDLDKLFPDDPS